MSTTPLYVIPNIPSWIPDNISGRIVTRRGGHIVPFGYHGIWMREEQGGLTVPARGYWLDIFQQMKLSWVVIINDGDSVLEVIDGLTPIEALLNIGVIPIIRGRIYFPGHFNDISTVERTVQIYANYGIKAPWIIGNEPLDPREWSNGEVPDYDTAMGIVTDRWKEAASQILSVGGVIGFPDGPCYAKNPFLLIQEYADAFEQGNAFYAAHNYGKGRPMDYPYDNVTQFGTRLTEEEYTFLLDDYAPDPAWREESIVLINQRRAELANPNLTGTIDPTCFRGWEQIITRSRETFGFDVPMALTEGGWCPRDRAGTGPNTDIRWPHTTPKMVEKKTVAMFDGNSPFFAICPWLIADDAMVAGGYVGWPYDAWIGWAYTDKYPYEKPVVTKLIQTSSAPLKEWAGRQCDNIV